jgi:hypothetical protein
VGVVKSEDNQKLFDSISYTIQDGDTPISIFQLQMGISYEEALPLIEKINEVFDTTTSQRIGSLTSPIMWYEYINP